MRHTGMVKCIMNTLLGNIVAMLAEYIEDAKPVAEADICRFVGERNIFLREDHLLFLMKFGGKVDGRLRMFHRYGGDFDFDFFKSAYVENFSDMRVPDGNTYFGTTYASGSLCVDCSSGKIYVYDEGDRYGLVHESIDGFALSCLVPIYAEKAFSNKKAELNVDLEFFNEFRVKNKKNKIVGANFFEIEYVDIDKPEAFAEYYWIGQKLVVLYIATQSIVTYG